MNLGGDFTTAGSNSLTLTTTGATNVTLPTSGTLITSSDIPPIPSLPISGANGGTGIANTGKSITLGGNLITSGAFDTTLTATATTSITLPTSGTLATTSQIPSLPLSGANGGTGVANTGKTITLGGNLTTVGAFNATLTLSNTTSLTLPTTGVLATTAQLPSFPVSVTNGGTGLSSTTINQILYSSATNTIAGIPTMNFGVCVTDGSGVPQIFSILPQQVQENITFLGNVDSNFMAMTVENVDGTATASTKIGTTDSGMRFVPIFINIEVTALSGFVTVASISVGTNATNYNDILAITPLTGLTSANTVLQLDANALLKSVPSATDIFVKITTGAVASSYTLRVSVLGFYY